MDFLHLIRSIEEHLFLLVAIGIHVLSLGRVPTP